MVHEVEVGMLLDVGSAQVVEREDLVPLLLQKTLLLATLPNLNKFQLQIVLLKYIRVDFQIS